jgi:thiosulfate reductase/polysulfide reductase chain A
MGLKISRRTFLKATGLAGAGVAMGGSLNLLSQSEPKAVKAAPSEDVKIVQTWCQMCSSGKSFCGINCHIKDGKWVNISGNPEIGNSYGVGSTSLCPKGNSGMQAPYVPNRLKYPMKRIGEKGEGKFKRITWDEAYKIIGDKYKETKEKYGPESLCMLSPEAWPVISTLGNRLLNVHGSPNYAHSAICAVQRMQTTAVTIGSAATAPGQVDKTKLIVNWGANTENAGCNRYGENLAGRLDALQKGCKLIDIRPMLDPLAAKADVWVPVRPGTDGALALGILNIIIGENLYDHEFVSQWCHGFDQLAEHVKQFTPEWASEKTGLPVEQIYKVARMMGTIKPMGIFGGNGVGDQQRDGHWGYAAILLIPAITGNLAIPGGGGAGLPTGPALIKVNAIDVLTSRMPESAEDKANGWVAGTSKLVAPELPAWMPRRTSAYYRAIMSILHEDPYPIRLLQSSRTTPFGATRNPHKVREALMKVEFLYTADVYWAPHLPYADVVLPACTGYEHSHQIAVKNMAEGTWLTITNAVVPAMYESKSDWEIFLGIGKAAGYGADFWDGDPEAFLRYQLEPSGYTLEEVRKNWVFVPRTDPLPAPTYKNYKDLFARLPHNKVQCYNEFVGGKPNCYPWGPGPKGTLGYLPEYKGPPEGIAETPELAKEYPLIITDVHADRRAQHSYYNDIPYLRELGPYPWCCINPATAKKYGIKNGDWMKIESIHGWIVLKAEYLEGISPECLMARRGWWQSCPELGLPGYDVFNGGADSSLLYNTDVELFDDFHSAMAKQTLVKISKSSTPPLTFDDKPRYEE